MSHDRLTCFSYLASNRAMNVQVGNLLHCVMKLHAVSVDMQTIPLKQLLIRGEFMIALVYWNMVFAISLSYWI